MNQQLQSNAIFKPLLQTFCEQTMPLQMDDHFSTVCLPHTMHQYANASRKFFYFGRDTNSWCKTGLLKKYYESNQLEKYLEDNAAFLNDFEFLFYNNNASFGFWSLVVNLHLRLKGVNQAVNVDEHLYDSDYMDLINDFGYGNTNSIELQASLINQGLWKSKDVPKYWKIKEKSTQMDRLKYTLDAYHPDLIFIFNWSADHTQFLEGLRYTINKTDFVNGHLWVINLLDYPTRIIWTLHPRSLMYNRLNINNFIDEILTQVEL